MPFAVHCERLEEVSGLVNAEIKAALDLLKNTSGQMTDHETLMVAKCFASGMGQLSLAIKPLLLEASALEDQPC